MTGTEWIVEAYGCNPESLSSLDTLKELFARIVRDLNLHPCGEQQWKQFPQSLGITGLCLLSESHLACHTFPEYGSLCLNLFCCRPRSEWNFNSQLREAFGAQRVSVRRLERPYVDSTDEGATAFSVAGSGKAQ
ncbi:MAG TPA: S-adenosylmethionine decarboxylase [Verrucomicrobiae bacterium]|jgi:S-adenosylmethionine decarboxylase|nr:S-adenosylmethionine decarboxylase [Verrucomicrobiae bacterium]